MQEILRLQSILRFSFVKKLSLRNQCALLVAMTFFAFAYGIRKTARRGRRALHVRNGTLLSMVLCRAGACLCLRQPRDRGGKMLAFEPRVRLWVAHTPKESRAPFCALLSFGAGYGNRTRLLGLGSRCTTDVRTLHGTVIISAAAEKSNPDSAVRRKNYFFRFALFLAFF